MLFFLERGVRSGRISRRRGREGRSVATRRSDSQSRQREFQADRVPQSSRSDVEAYFRDRTCDTCTSTNNHSLNGENIREKTKPALSRSNIFFSEFSPWIDRANAMPIVYARFVRLQITMTVLRHEKPTEEYEVEIQKKSGRGAGICFSAFRSGKGAYVTELVCNLVFSLPFCHYIRATLRNVDFCLCRCQAVKPSKLARSARAIIL